jgi:energy-coupling factor transporter ATP-binding protein EcfA2
VTGILGRVREVARGDRPINADALVNRVRAVQRFLNAVGGSVPDDRLNAVHTVVERAGDRLSLSRDHTVVALAGSTGSGKSSLFNALANLYLSPVGVRRPTTGVAYACVWGPLFGATGLLDWVGVLPRHRYVRESALDGEDQAALHGLVLLDLPDFDSVERSHRLEVDRLLGLVDLVVWVVDPQKYADTVLHDGYLRQFHQHRDVTVVVLNHADRLAPADVQRCLTDLGRLLHADGLGEVPTFATSAYQPEALVELRTLLEKTVVSRQAALRRLSGDLDAVVANMSGLIGPPVAEDAVDRNAVRALTAALVPVAGVPVVIEATERAYRQRAASAMGWPPTRWLHRLRVDPLRRLHLTQDGVNRPQGDLYLAQADRADAAFAAQLEGAGRSVRSFAGGGFGFPGPVPMTSIPRPEPAQQSAADLAVRALATQASHQLPEPWPAAVTAAARSRLADLPYALDRAVAVTGPGMIGAPQWWRLVAGVQWLGMATALIGLLWLGAGYALAALALPVFDYPTFGVIPVPTALLLGGLLGGALLSALIRPVVRYAARRAGARAENRLRSAITEVGREYVVAPVRTVLQRYAEAREALVAARGAQ